MIPVARILDRLESIYIQRTLDEQAYKNSEIRENRIVYLFSIDII